VVSESHEAKQLSQDLIPGRRLNKEMWRKIQSVHPALAERENL
jgi:hypothetical protein